MRKHTPGPWYAMTGETGGIIDQATIFSEHENADGEHTYIADTMPIDDGEVPLEQRKANATLMAAAPVMFDKLMEIIGECEAGPGQGLRQIVAKKAREAIRTALPPAEAE